MKGRLLPILLLSFLAAAALAALEVPSLHGRVNDLAGILSAAEREALETQLAGIEKTTGAQMVFLSVPTLDGDTIEDFGIRVGEAWKIGSRGRDDGMILLVALQERQLRIEVGYGLEGKLTDGECGTLIREVLAPAFRRNEPAAGLAAVFAAAARRIGGGELGITNAAASGGGADDPANIKYILVALAVLVLLGVVSGRGRGFRSGFGSSSFFGGGGSGGGFSGGGGSFGGGGASGSW